MSDDELLISVDIEASGPSPGTGSLLSVGACLVDDSSKGIYLELKPLPDRPWSEEAEGIHCLDRGYLEQHGLEPGPAMERLAGWLAEVADGRQVVFVGLNAPFDWSFVNDYFLRFVGHNPFGWSALDVKAYYMGLRGEPRWSRTSRLHINAHLGLDTQHTHNALDDAREQAEVMRLLRARPD